MIRSKPRVRVHLFDRDPRVASPSVEGVLIRRIGREFHVAVPELVAAPDRDPIPLDSARVLVIPRENVAFFEELR